MKCQGEKDCPNEGVVELTATGYVGDSDVAETVHMLLCEYCAQKALHTAASKMLIPQDRDELINQFKISIWWSPSWKQWFAMAENGKTVSHVDRNAAIDLAWKNLWPK